MGKRGSVVRKAISVRHTTGNRAEDVVNPLFKEAEDRALVWLRGAFTNAEVRDRRKEKTYFDFSLGPIKVDVKCDQQARATGNVVWEEEVEYRGVVRQGWGNNNGLDYVLFVFPPSPDFEGIGDDEGWRGLLVNAQELRDMARGAGTRAFTKEGSDGRVAHGRVVPLSMLRSGGAITLEMGL